jgi:hypothetical protein
MSNKFNTHLDAIIMEEFGEGAAEDLINIAKELMSTVSQMEQDIAKSKLQLSHILEELNSSLGREIRKIQPKMNISIRDGNCAAGYHSKDVVCRPDVEKGIWMVSGRLGNGFKRHFPEVLKLSPDVKPLAQSITDYFKKYYRTL